MEKTAAKTIIVRESQDQRLGYRFLDHATDAIVEIRAKDLKEAFSFAADAVISITLEQDLVKEREQRRFSASGKDLRYLLFSWLEEIPFVLITEGFAIKKTELSIKQDGGYRIDAIAYGEPLDLGRHGFKVEIKAPTFHEMEIIGDDKGGGIFMKFLLDL